MPSINQVTVMGHLGRDPEIRYSQSGKAFANLAIATSYKPRDGEEQTEWHRVVCFGAMAEQMQYAKKGDLVSVQGRLQTRKWQGQDGQDRYTTEIIASIAVLATWHKQEQQPSTTSYPNQAKAHGVVPKPEFDDDIPF